MTLAKLTRHQVWLYLAAFITALAVGSQWPTVSDSLDRAIWPVLGLLLYVTFVLIPFDRVREALRDKRFLAASVVGNFLVIPPLVGVATLLLPDSDALRLGVFLVLAVPCTDWFITFSMLAKGSHSHALSVTPVNLLLQLALVPVYLRIFVGEEAHELWTWSTAAPAVVMLAVPLVAAILTEVWFSRHKNYLTLTFHLERLPVPLVAIVIALVAGSQAEQLLGSSEVLAPLVVAFAAFVVFALALAWVVSRVLGLPHDQGRTLAFSFGTRNSFVVLPIALVMPVGWELVAVVVVVQSIVELLGMIAYLGVVPRLFPAR